MIDMFFCIPCLVLISYFAVASIFFPKYRSYIKEGWRCFWDKLKGRKCSASFDNRMRLAVSMWFSERGMPSVGRFLHNERNFNLTLIVVGVVSTIISIILFIILINFLTTPYCPACVVG